MSKAVSDAACAEVRKYTLGIVRCTIAMDSMRVKGARLGGKLGVSVDECRKKFNWSGGGALTFGSIESKATVRFTVKILFSFNFSVDLDLSGRPTGAWAIANNKLVASGKLTQVRATKTFTIPVTQDTLVEGAETVNLSLGTVTGTAALGTQTTHTATITDDEAAGTVAFTAATSAEDETNLSRVGTDIQMYKALSEGYLSTAGEFLTDTEVALMPFAARLVTFTIGLRFLADYLAGDHYFKIDRTNHNLDRARVQFGMVEDMERHADQF